MNKIASGISVVGLFGALAVTTGCSEKAENPAAKPTTEETELQKAQQELEEEKKELAMMAEATRIAEEKAAMEAKLAEAKKKEEAAREKRLEEERQKELAAARKKAATEKARNGLIGTKLPTLTTAKGVTYKLVEINSVTPVGLGIVHDAGAAKVPLAELSEEWQKKVFYDPVEAKEFAEAQAAKQADYKKAVAATKKANHAREQANTEGEKVDKNQIAVSAEERKLQALVEKYVNLRQKAQVEVTRAYGDRAKYTRNSANWNTVDKRIGVFQNKVYEYQDQELRYRSLLHEKEEARRKEERARRDEQRRRERAAARAR